MRSALLAALLTLPSLALAEVPSSNFGDDFGGISYMIDSGGEVQVWAAPRDAGGKLAICGVVVFEKATATTRAIERRFSERISFTLGGQAVHVQTDVFKRYKTMDEAIAADKSGCSISNLPWDKGYSKAKLDMNLVATTITY